MKHASANWIGRGTLAALTVPVVAAAFLGVLRSVGVSVGDLNEYSASMIVVWGSIVSAVLAAPIAFVLGAWAVRSAERMRTGRKPSAAVVRRCSSVVACGGALWGIVLAFGLPTGMHVGWPLVAVGLCAGTVGGAFAAWALLSDDAGLESHAA
jgi:hypothetical protein